MTTEAASCYSDGMDDDKIIKFDPKAKHGKKLDDGPTPTAPKLPFKIMGTVILVAALAFAYCFSR